MGVVLLGDRRRGATARKRQTLTISVLTTPPPSDINLRDTPLYSDLQ